MPEKFHKHASLDDDHGPFWNAAYRAFSPEHVPTLVYYSLAFMALFVLALLALWYSFRGTFERWTTFNMALGFWASSGICSILAILVGHTSAPEVFFALMIAETTLAVGWFLWVAFWECHNGK